MSVHHSAFINYLNIYISNFLYSQNSGVCPALSVKVYLHKVQDCFCPENLVRHVGQEHETSIKLLDGGDVPRPHLQPAKSKCKTMSNKSLNKHQNTKNLCSGLWIIDLETTSQIIWTNSVILMYLVNGKVNWHSQLESQVEILKFKGLCRAITTEHGPSSQWSRVVHNKARKQNRWMWTTNYFLGKKNST